MIYNLDGKDSNRIKFNRRLFNYKLQSHKGKYQTVSKGILKKYQKPTRSVVIFEKKYLNKVRKLLEEYVISSRIYQIQKEIK